MPDEQYNFVRDAIQYINNNSTYLSSIITNEKARETYLKAVNEIFRDSDRYDDESDEFKNALDNGDTAVNQSAQIADGEGETSTLPEPGKVYRQPDRTGKVNETASGDGLEQAMTDADSFLDDGKNDKIDLTDFQSQFSDIYNIFLQVGVAIAVIVGLILGIKFMLSSVEGKADVKKMLTVYVISCIVIFGSFGIWKIAITILQTV